MGPSGAPQLSWAGLQPGSGLNTLHCHWAPPLLPGAQGRVTSSGYGPEQASPPHPQPAHSQP
uniref:Uncharacterized protein n=1 Tax=Colobus angolensis palliatus TaxID=336983 RepID=A0A2K5HZ66_COLAP